MAIRFPPTARLAVLPTFLATALALLWWVNLSGERSPSQASAVATSTAVDWYAYGVDYRKFGRDGSLRYRWSTPRVDHFDLHGITGLRHPHVVVYNRDDSRWITDARFGTVTDGNSKVVLCDDVSIVKRDGSVTVHTQLLRGDLARNFVETDRPVAVVRKADHTDAVGMRAWLDDERYELLSQVVTIHEPNY